jgi:hypothetical protein
MMVHFHILFTECQVLATLPLESSVGMWGLTSNLLLVDAHSQTYLPDKQAALHLRSGVATGVGSPGAW